MLHNIVVKTLYTTKQARSDNCIAVAFLTKRAREHNKYDWNKLVHKMRYKRGTGDLILILSANGSGVLKW